MNGAFARSHPAVGFLYFAAVIAFSLVLNHPVFIALSLVSSLAYAVRLKGKSVMKTFFFALLPLAVFVTLINALVSHYGVTVLYTFPNGNNLTLESIVYGAVTGVTIVTMMLWFVCWNEVMTEDKILHLFGKRLPHLALLVMMTLRFVPLYSRQLGEALSARKGAGLEESGGKIAKIKNGCAAVSGVITRALEHGIDTADSMKSRGYGLKGRTSYSRYKLSPADTVLIVATVIALIPIVAARLCGAVQALYNPIIMLGGFTPALIASSAAYAVLCFLPLIYDASEVIKWNRLYAKT